MSDYYNKNILAIDCASNQMKLGLQFGGDRLVKSNTEAKQSHSALIIGKILSLLKSAACEVTDIDAIVVATGPGSFTGLRIGIACAKGMAVALNIPVVGVNLFELAAHKLSNANSKVKVVLPFKKDSVFTGIVENGKCDLATIETVAVKDLTQHISGMMTAGVGFDVSKIATDKNKIVGSDKTNYDATEIIYLGVEKLNHGDIPGLAQLEPLYVQKSQAEINFERDQSKTK